MQENRENKYDKVFRENLERPSRELLRFLLSVDAVEVIPIPPITRQTVVERETDMLVQVTCRGRKPFILHLEFQSSNDSTMPVRMAVYDYMVYLEHKLEVKSIVMYTGRQKLNMESSVSFNGNYFGFKLVDIRNIDPELFLRSENPKETVLAILAGYKKEESELIITGILNKLLSISESESELREGIKELEIQKLLIKEVQKMPIVYDIRKDLRFRQGKSEGLSQGLSEGLSRGISQGLSQGLTQGMEQATKERNTAFVINLLQNTSHSIEEIARLVNVPQEFVTGIKDGLD